MKRSRAVTLGAWVGKDTLFGLKARLNRDGGMKIGARHREFTLDESLAYIDMVVGDYRRYAGLTEDTLGGKTVLEVGPGDNYGVALEMIGDGADRVVCLDRFEIWRDPGQQSRIYEAQVARAEGDRRARMEAALNREAEFGLDPQCVLGLEGIAIEDAPELLEDRFDVMVSRAVLAHVWDLDRALDSMDLLLRPGGMMAHKVDLSDHGLLTDGDHHPLEFLTVSDVVWDRMRRNTGLTNRKLLDSYREGFAARGYDTELPVVRVIGDADELDPHHAPLTAEELARATARIDEIRSRLLPRYSALEDSDLAAAGTFLVARKSFS